MNTKELSVSFYGGVGTVTGANFLLEGPNFRGLVDCGLIQGSLTAEAINNEPFAYEADSIDFLFVTHAHIDHIGRIPLLVKSGFNGLIYSTAETREIAELMLLDAARIMDTEARSSGILPSYDSKDVEKAFSLWKEVPYHKETKIRENLSVFLQDAGHILGSSMFLFTYSDEAKKTKILFTGDLGNSPSILLPDTEFVKNTDYIVMDSVYGDRNHEDKEERDARFRRIIQDVIDKKGTLIIPAFSLERTQAILYVINNLVEEKVIEAVPVFLDSPLAIKLTEIYKKISNHYNKGVTDDISHGDKIFEFPKLVFTARVEDSKRIHEAKGPKIIVAGSGMSTAGRVLHHEERYLPDPNATILITGYQAPGTLGREIQEGNKEVMIHGKKIKVRARIETIEGYSGHKDSDHLIEFVENATEGRLKKVFVVMGEPKSSLFLVQRLRDYLGVDAIAPEKGKKYFIS